MNQPTICITVPILSLESTVWFSVYGFGWGYRAFELSRHTVCESLGARDMSEQQILLAFQLGKRQILDAVLQQASLCYHGERILLSLDAKSQRMRTDAPKMPKAGAKEEAAHMENWLANNSTIALQIN
ncbi:hypothetical protein SCB29_30105 [Paraburkholderia sp. SIMBA_055]|jgi:hypothetical protein|uniref:Uncharacterized protein n=1 Tax=Paraburkholderia graminis (strain ATCC 700544 / DSM 17151 / LMG 18924 / NCIMB 13744 / C4D1M) TaxID=396598 RepID=B1G481_PARG4|nr:hypothetical protein [Paraburkholderia graminis]EDT09094.1 hypothetical protein BgramDRAFT_4146 [Paraburkholderia graminis C4D1M]CAB3734399.1 hypothetical protein R8871_06050 [Paraburkholderia graminis C4D1M]